MIGTAQGTDRVAERRAVVMQWAAATVAQEQLRARWAKRTTEAKKWRDLRG